MSTSGSVSPCITSDFITLAGTYFYLGRDLRLDLAGANPFTLEGWMGFTPLDSAALVFSKPGELVLGFSKEGRFFARRRFWQYSLVSSQPLAAGVWHHLGVTCDGERWALYINGVLDAVDDGDGEDGRAPLNTGAPQRLASLHCEVWNLRVWNVARSAEQMSQTMDRVMVPQSGLVASFFPELPAASSLDLASDQSVAHSAA